MGASTILQVAEQAGVSVATVSRVINQSGTVSPKTAEKVMDAIRSLGYQPNVWGRNLRRGESRVALVLVPNVTNPYYAPIIAGAEDLLSTEGYSAMLCITNLDLARRDFYLDFMRDGRADGAILMDTVMDDPNVARLAEKYPLVQCCEYCGSQKVSHVSIDNFQGAFQAVSKLLELGHTRVGFIGADNRFVSTLCRRDGYRAALRAGGLSVREEYEVYASGDYSFVSGVEAAKGLLKGPDRPTALFCISDVLALGVLRAAGEMGLRVPEDLSVVGFDDVEYAGMFAPRLTTVRQPCYELGKKAAQLLLDQVRGEDRVRREFLPHEIVVRDSTAICR